MIYFKNSILRFKKVIVKKDKPKDNDTEVDIISPKKIEEKNAIIIECQENNIKTKETNKDFKKDIEYEIPRFNSEDINYLVSSSSLSRYSLNSGDFYKNENDYYNYSKDIKKLELGSLDLFEMIEMNYFEELERYEKQLGDLERFRYSTSDEIGLEAELRVQSELLLLDGNEYKIIHNILVPSHNGKSTQIDSIVVSKYGIFIIETKKYRGIIIGEEDSKYWTRYYRTVAYNKKFRPNKVIVRKFYNPIRQNLGHILSLKKLLNNFKDLKFYSIVVFDETADLKVKTMTEVVYVKNLVDQIKRYNKVVIDKGLVEELYNEILRYKLDDYISLQEHLVYVTNIKERESIYHDKNIKLDYLLTLCITPRIGTKTIDLIKVIYKNIDGTLDTIDDLIDILNKCYKVNSFITVPSKKILEYYYQRALKLIDDYNEQGVLMTPYYDLNYPRRVSENNDYPQIIFSLGDIRILNNGKKIGILVSHSPTKYGRSCAYRLGELCAINNITVVSIVGEDYDLSVVKGALDKGGKVILVKFTKFKLSDSDSDQCFYNKIINNKGCIICFTNGEDLASDYKILKFNRTFMKIIDKLILVEPYLNDNIKRNIINEIYTDELELGYVPQSKSSELLGNVDHDEILMSKLNAIKLSDPMTLGKFLT